VIARALLVAVALASPAGAADRSYSVTDFDQIDINGPYQVIVETGRPPSARATADQASLDRLLVEVRSRRLVITASTGGWGERGFLKSGPTVIRVSTQGLKRAHLGGSGSLDINRVQAARLFVSQSGSGQIRIGRIDTDQLDVVAEGSGLVTLAGKNLTGRITNNGAGRIDAAALTITNADIRAQSAGETSLTALRSAKIVATGSGNVTVGGTPACTVTQLGAGLVRCGPDQ
jgi:hypothetical protein